MSPRDHAPPILTAVVSAYEGNEEPPTDRKFIINLSLDICDAQVKVSL